MKIEKITSENVRKIYDFIDKYNENDTGVISNIDEFHEFLGLVKRLHANYNWFYVKCKELIMQKGNVDVLEVEIAEQKIKYDNLKKQYKNLSNKLINAREKANKNYADYKRSQKKIDKLKRQLEDLED